MRQFGRSVCSVRMPATISAAIGVPFAQFSRFHKAGEKIRRLFLELEQKWNLLLANKKSFLRDFPRVKALSNSSLHLRRRREWHKFLRLLIHYSITVYYCNNLYSTYVSFGEAENLQSSILFDALCQVLRSFRLNSVVGQVENVELFNHARKQSRTVPRQFVNTHVQIFQIFRESHAYIMETM